MLPTFHLCRWIRKRPHCGGPKVGGVHCQILCPTAPSREAQGAAASSEERVEPSGEEGAAPSADEGAAASAEERACTTVSMNVRSVPTAFRDASFRVPGPAHQGAGRARAMCPGPGPSTQSAPDHTWGGGVITPMLLAALARVEEVPQAAVHQYCRRGGRGSIEPNRAGVITEQTILLRTITPIGVTVRSEVGSGTLPKQFINWKSWCMWCPETHFLRKQYPLDYPPPYCPPPP
jgi:hypothetical protein